VAGPARGGGYRGNRRGCKAPHRGRGGAQAGG